MAVSGLTQGTVHLIDLPTAPRQVKPLTIAFAAPGMEEWLSSWTVWVVKVMR